MEEVKSATYDYQQKLVREGQYRPLETFLDRECKANAKSKDTNEQEKVSLDFTPMSAENN